MLTSRVDLSIETHGEETPSPVESCGGQCCQAKAFEAFKIYDFGNHEFGISEALELITDVTDRLR